MKQVSPQGQPSKTNKPSKKKKKAFHRRSHPKPSNISKRDLDDEKSGLSVVNGMIVHSSTAHQQEPHQETKPRKSQQRIPKDDSVAPNEIQKEARNRQKPKFCKHKDECRNPKCSFQHLPSRSNDPETKIESESTKEREKETSGKASKLPKKCKYKDKCKNPKCKFRHPPYSSKTVAANDGRQSPSDAPLQTEEVPNQPVDSQSVSITYPHKEDSRNRTTPLESILHNSKHAKDPKKRITWKDRGSLEQDDSLVTEQNATEKREKSSEPKDLDPTLHVFEVVFYEETLGLSLKKFVDEVGKLHIVVRNVTNPWCEDTILPGDRILSIGSSSLSKVSCTKEVAKILKSCDRPLTLRFSRKEKRGNLQSQIPEERQLAAAAKREEEESRRKHEEEEAHKLKQEQIAAAKRRAEKDLAEKKLREQLRMVEAAKQEKEAARKEEEEVAKKARQFTEEQEAIAREEEEKKRLRAQRLREQKENARSKTKKDVEKQVLRSKQIVEERMQYWEVDRKDRSEYFEVLRLFCRAEANRKTLAMEASIRDEALAKIQADCDSQLGKTYDVVFPERGSHAIEIADPQNKTLHGRTGHILSFDESKKKYKVGLETKKKMSLEEVFVPPEHLKVPSVSLHRNRNHWNEDDFSQVARITTMGGDIHFDRSLALTLIYRHREDKDKLSSKIAEILAKRTYEEEQERIRVEKERLLRKQEAERARKEEERRAEAARRAREEEQREYDRQRSRRQAAQRAQEREWFRAETARRARQEEEREYYQYQGCRHNCPDCRRQRKQKEKQYPEHRTFFKSFFGNTVFGVDPITGEPKVFFRASPFFRGPNFVYEDGFDDEDEYDFDYGEDNRRSGNGYDYGEDSRRSDNGYDYGEDNKRSDNGYNSHHIGNNHELSAEEYAAILGVSVDATAREIRLAYKKKALQWHPDKYKGKDNHTGITQEESAEEFIKCNHAHEFLMRRFVS